jgi:hypothetical protein
MMSAIILKKFVLSLHLHMKKQKRQILSRDKLDQLI